MTETTPPQAASPPTASQINSCILQALEGIYERCGPYCGPSAHAASHSAFLEQAETFCRRVLDHMELVRSQLRLRLSTASRINQLPADVLIHVFSVMRFDDLVTATHVCHQWRKLGLETPALWTTLKLDGPVLRDGDVLLERAKASAIDLALSPGYKSAIPAGESVAFLTPRMDRLRRLSIYPRPAEDLLDRLVDVEQYTRIPVVLPRDTRLQHLSIDWDTADGRIAIRVPPPSDDPGAVDFPLLREVVLRRGVHGVEFLYHCTRLTLLSLQIPEHFPVMEALRIVKANPLLQHLALQFPVFSDDPHRFPEIPWDHPFIHPSLRSIDLGEGQLSDRIRWMFESDRSSNIVLASLFFACFDCSRVPDVSISFTVDESGVAFYDDVLSELEDIAVFDAWGTVLTAYNLRKWRQRFFKMDITRALELSLQQLQPHLRALRVSAQSWRDANSQSLPHSFPELEELWLSGTGAEYAMLPPARAGCPRLRRLALHVDPHSHALRAAIDGTEGSETMSPDEWLAVGVAIALLRVCRSPMPRLERLAIVAGSSVGDTTTWACAAPLPQTIDLYVAGLSQELDAMPVLLDSEDFRSPWRDFPSIDALRHGMDPDPAIFAALRPPPSAEVNLV